VLVRDVSPAGPAAVSWVARTAARSPDKRSEDTIRIIPDDPTTGGVREHFGIQIDGWRQQATDLD
jgi:hypothetical protein